MEILRLPEKEISEVAINVKRFEHVHEIAGGVENRLAAGAKDPKKFPLQVHTWSDLSPFANIARMIDVMTFFIKLMLIGIVLISILNVMIMAVYERVREIGTIAAIGTLPGKILSLFLVEGFFLGVCGAVIGVAVAAGIVVGANLWQFTFDFGQNRGLILAPAISIEEVLVACLMVVAVSVLASLQPAYKASRMEPIDALRHV
jgi:putative ABC transport system permease protein